MNVVILNTSEKIGGAAIAANRIMIALNKSGINAKMIVRDKQTNDSNVISINSSDSKKYINLPRFYWERFIIFINNKFNKNNLFKVSIANTGYKISHLKEIEQADIIHLHWINQGFISLKEIKCLIESGKPIVWTMHDMWPCTGICHHAYKCDKYTNECGKCFFLNSGKSNDLSQKIWQKKKLSSFADITVVTVSSWLKNRVKKSSLMGMSEVTVIPNVIDTNTFRPYNKKEALTKLNLPENKKIILMGAARLDDDIKGGFYLQNALQFFSQRKDILLVLFGEIKNKKSFINHLPIDYIHLGSINDTSKIAKLYSAADVTICSSLYETFGQTISESMACGCPVVSFNNGGQTDIIDHMVNGYLAKSEDIEDLAKGIEWILNNTDSEQLSIKAREKVITNYNEDVIAKQYIRLYESLLN